MVPSKVDYFPDAPNDKNYYVIVIRREHGRNEWSNLNGFVVRKYYLLDLFSHDYFWH